MDQDIITEFEYDTFNNDSNKVFEIFNKLTFEDQLTITSLYEFNPSNLPIIFKDSNRLYLLEWYVNAIYGLICVLRIIFYTYFESKKNKVQEERFLKIAPNLISITNTSKQDIIDKIQLPLNTQAIIYMQKMFNTFYDTLVQTLKYLEIKK